MIKKDYACVMSETIELERRDFTKHSQGRDSVVLGLECEIGIKYKVRTLV